MLSRSRQFALGSLLVVHHDLQPHGAPWETCPRRTSRLACWPHSQSHLSGFVDDDYSFAVEHGPSVFSEGLSRRVPADQRDGLTNERGFGTIAVEVQRGQA